jgi:hypothetical protein
LQQLVRLFGDATYFLEQLIKGLRAKRREGTWDRSMGVKQRATGNIGENADVAFALPDDLDEAE